MTVTNTDIRNDLVGNGSATSFSYTFYLRREADLTVYLDGVLTPGGFTVTGVGNQSGGTVIFDTAPGDGTAVLLLRDSELAQQTDYLEFDAFPAETHEGALDDGILIDQELNGRLDRSLHYANEAPPNLLPSGDPVGELPNPVPNTAIGYDAVGNLANVPIGTGGAPVVNPLTSDLLSNGFGFVINPDLDPGTELGRITDSLDGIDISTPNLTQNGKLILTDAPSDGEQYLRQDAAWTVVSVPPGTLVQDANPGPSPEGQLWYQSSTGRLFMYYSNPGVFVEVGPAPGFEPLPTGYKVTERQNFTDAATVEFDEVLVADADYLIDGTARAGAGSASAALSAQVMEGAAWQGDAGAYSYASLNHSSERANDAVIARHGTAQAFVAHFGFFLSQTQDMFFSLEFKGAASAGVLTSMRAEHHGAAGTGFIGVGSASSQRVAAVAGERLRLTASIDFPGTQSITGTATLYKRLRTP